MTTATYTIPNISCGHCVHTIQRELTELEGVSRVQASESTKQVTVEFSHPATEEKIETLLAEINYPPAQ
ncbi:MAG: heavy-metal-associated domain-containing protein [Anaerolineales bacterium]